MTKIEYYINQADLAHELYNKLEGEHVAWSDLDIVDGHLVIISTGKRFAL